MESDNLIGFAITGSFCTISKSLDIMQKLILKGYDILPIMSENAYLNDTRFGKACEIREKIEDLTKKEIYTLSPAEVSANEFASGITMDLAKYDELSNYLYYAYYISLMDADIRRDVEEEVIMHDLNVALTLLKYKTQTVVSKGNYLDIDPDELEKSILKQIAKRKETKAKKGNLSGAEKLLNKISKK